MTWLYDAHIHLSDPAYGPDIGFTLTSMEKMKIKACCVSTNNGDSLQTLSLAKKSGLVLPFIGIHPEMAGDDLDLMASKIHEHHALLSGIGEVGLDPTYASLESDSKRQTLVFEALLSLAEKYGKPVSIHSRKSLDDIYKILPSYSIGGKLLHWFDGSKKQLRQAMDLDCYVSFGPVTVYADDKQALLQEASRDRILVETDGPVAFSRCFERRPAQISFIPSVVFCASKVLGMSYGQTSSVLHENSVRYLGTQA